MPGLYFPPFHLDLARAELRRGEQRLPLRAWALALLEYLAARSGRLLSSAELLQAVWPDVAVSAVGLKVCIRELRVALGDTARAPRFIEAVPRRGYRFIAAVEDETARFRADDYATVHLPRSLRRTSSKGMSVEGSSSCSAIRRRNPTRRSSLGSASASSR